MKFFIHKSWIPNTLTMGNLVFGFLSLVFASEGSFVFAGSCIMIAALLDGFDGQIARMLGVESRIGAELDSLADCVTFGVAPGYLAYSAYLHDITMTFFSGSFRAGALIASVLPVCAAYRLARFNVSHSSTSFRGLPSPIAGLAITLVPMLSEILWPGIQIESHLDIFVPFYVMISTLMVTTITFTKPQQVLLSRIHGFKLLLLLTLIAAAALFLGKRALFAVPILLFIYLLSGIVSFVIQLIQDNRYRRPTSGR